MDLDYEKLLDRAVSKLPNKRIFNERFNIPEIKLYSEGKTIIIENFMIIADTIRRDLDHIMKYLTRELGTAGKIDNQRAVFQGRFTKDQIESNIKSYVKEYVICSECNRPDTKLEKKDRILILKCDACGAHRPVRKRQNTTVKSLVTEEGSIHEVLIESVGSKGDGIAKINKYTVFIPNTTKGETVTIKIKKISGNLAFGEKT